MHVLSVKVYIQMIQLRIFMYLLASWCKYQKCHEVAELLFQISCCILQSTLVQQLYENLPSKELIIKRRTSCIL